MNVPQNILKSCSTHGNNSKEVIPLVYIYQCKKCNGRLETDEQINCKTTQCSKCSKCLYSLAEKFGCNGKISEEESNVLHRGHEKSA